MSGLVLSGICKAFDGAPLLEEVSLAVAPGEIVAVLGVSGVGKSTLFSIAAGLTPPDAGRVTLGGEDITGRPGAVAFMQQKDLLLPWKTLLDNVALPLVLRGVSPKQARAEAAAQLAPFGLSGHEKKYPAQLSGGMRQRASLLRASLCSGGALLLDEPFSALDALTRAETRRFFVAQLARLNLPALLITHDVEEALLLADRVCLLAGRPARLTDVFPVDAPRPRGEDFAASEPFIGLKKAILSRLEE